MTRAARRGAALLAALVVTAAPAAMHAAVAWTLVVSPPTVSTGAATTFSLTATNRDPQQTIRCVIVNVPASFVVDGAAVVGSSAGPSWIAVRARNWVAVLARSGGDELGALDTVDFTIHAVAVSAGSLPWMAYTYGRNDCGGGASSPDLPPTVVVSGPVVTPTPSATPRPTPAPTATPAPSVTPRPTVRPSATPQPSVAPTAAPTSRTPSPASSIASPGAPGPSANNSTGASLQATASPQPSGDPRAGVGGVGGVGGGSGRPDGPSPSAAAGSFDVPATATQEGAVAVDGLNVALGIDTWAVPAATLGLPGLLVLLWVAAQTVGAVAWIPAVKRLRGDDEGPAT